MTIDIDMRPLERGQAVLARYRRGGFRNAILTDVKDRALDGEVLRFNTVFEYKGDRIAFLPGAFGDTSKQDVKWCIDHLEATASASTGDRSLELMIAFYQQKMGRIRQILDHRKYMNQNQPIKNTQTSPDVYKSLPGMIAGKATGQIVAAVFRNSEISDGERCEFAKTAATQIDDICATLSAKGALPECIASYRKWYGKGYAAALDGPVSFTGKGA